MKESTQGILDIFRQISKIPRKSKHEQQISRWLMDQASVNNLDAEADDRGNVVIRVPASTGHDQAPILVFQGHMDMVCEKEPDSGHDFSKDPIDPQVDGDWLRANGTTLGADNGIGMALALHLAAQPAIAHPPLELLFTVDEETGLTGASHLKPGFIKGKILINLDSEDEGIFTIGCAGGSDAILTLTPEIGQPPWDAAGLSIRTRGLLGGHSGIDIHKHRANGIVLLSRVLDTIERNFDMRLVGITGGSARNAIPRDVEAIVAVAENDRRAAAEIAETTGKIFKDEYSAAEKALKLKVGETDVNGHQVLSRDSTRRLIGLLRILPSGVLEMSSEIEGLVETSCNLAIIKKKGTDIAVYSSQRSSVMSMLDEVTNKIEHAGRLAGCAFRMENSYPSWKPNPSSCLLERCRNIYEKFFGVEPEIEAIHAGLECAVIGDRYEDMDMISIGPTIVSPHSPDERVLIPTIGKVWNFLTALVSSYTEEIKRD